MAVYRFGLLRSLLLLIATTFVAAYSPRISLTTTSTVSSASPSELFQFLASPTNWPRIVASSHSVRSVNEADLSKPLPVGKSVDEIFGLPPVLPLSVRWKCTTSKPPTSNRAGCLEFDSEQGVPGLASNCRMLFAIDPSDPDNEKDNEASATVRLTMEYSPENILARLATPVLSLDNALALKVFLPPNFKESNKLDDFRQLMGMLYGIAGVAHFADLILGSSQLLVMAGSPPFYELPLEGQAFALLWCAMGPLAFVLAKSGPKLSDLGLILYGAVEVLGARLVAASDLVAAPPMMDPWTNAVIVQAIVLITYGVLTLTTREEGKIRG